MSELEIKNGNKNLICCFGGMALQMGGIPPFEFLNYLSQVYTNDFDLLFYIDKKQCWYQRGIDGITTDIHETVEYLNKKINNYDIVIFMGVSSGGYASILFGSLCNNVTYVIGFVPQSIIHNSEKYGNLKSVINNTTSYILYGNKNNIDENDIHNITHCENLDCFRNVKVIKLETMNIKQLRDNGSIKNMIDNILN